MCDGAQAQVFGRLMNLMIQLAVTAGLAGGVVIWQWNKAKKLLRLEQGQQAQIEQRQQQIKAAVATLVIGPPLAEILLAQIGVTFADCLEFTPFI